MTRDDDRPVFPMYVPGNEARGDHMQIGAWLSDYYAAHCPLSVVEAWQIWSNRPPTLFASEDRAGFWTWFAAIRHEYADAMLAARKEASDVA